MIDAEQALRRHAAHMGWPDGAADACIRLRREHPRWNVYWSARPMSIEPNARAVAGYQASLGMAGFRSELSATTIDELRRKIMTVESELPP